MESRVRPATTRIGRWRDENYDASDSRKGDESQRDRSKGHKAVMSPTISIVIPTRNAGPYFEGVMEGIAKQGGVKIARVVVADSRSDDETRGIAERFGAEVLEVDPSRFNHGSTRSEAIRRTETTLVVLMTQDALLSKTDVLSRMATHFADTQVAGVCVRQAPRGQTDTPANRRWLRLNRQGRSVTVQAVPPEGYEALSAARKMQLCAFDNVCSTIRREAFDEHPFRATAFAEDRLWARDVIRAGWKVIYDGRIEVTHSHAPDLRERLARAFVNHRAMCRYFGYRFVDNPVAFTVYAAKAAYGAVLDGAELGIGTVGQVSEAGSEVLAALASLAGMLMGVQEGELK